MNIVDFDSLKAAVADYLNRTDLTMRIPDFIGFAEVWMMRKLRLRLLEATATLVSTAGVRTISLPTDYREPLNLWYDNGVDREPLRFVPPALTDVWTQQGRPYLWTIDGANVAFERPCDQAYNFPFRYRQKIALSDDTPTNALLTQYPDIYLAATMVEAAPYLKDPDALQMWLDKRGHLEHDIREEEERQKSLATLSTEISRRDLRYRVGADFNILRGY